MSEKIKIRRKQACITLSQRSGLDNTSNNIEKATKTWKLILVGYSLVGTGFGAGIYVGNNNSRIRYQDKVNEYRERIIEIGKEHEKEIHEYNHEIFELADENNDLKQQIRQFKTKKK